MPLYKVGDKSEIIKNPNGKGFAVILNPVGDKTHGYLDWSDIKYFKKENDAKAFKRFIITGKSIRLKNEGNGYYSVIRKR